jgi:hypothetical protein
MKLRLLLVCCLLLPFPALSAQRSFPADATPEQFAQWQQEARSFLSTALFNGPPPERVALEPAFGVKQQREGYELTEVTFHDRPGHVAMGWLARPRNPRAARLPLIMSLHGHDFDAHDTFDPNNMYYYGDFFARQGYIVFAIQIGHDYIDHDRPLTGLGPLHRNVPFPYMGQKTWMVMRAIDLMLAQPDVDPEKIGVVGLSNGGLTSMYVGAMDPRVKLTVASGSLLMHRRLFHPPITPCRCEYVEGIDGQLDFYDVFALIAPRALVVQNGVEDPICPINSVRKAFTFIKKAYAIAGVPDRAYQDIHPGVHEFKSEVPEQWFHQYLPLPPG